MKWKELAVVDRAWPKALELRYWSLFGSVRVCGHGHIPHLLPLLWDCLPYLPHRPLVLPCITCSHV